MHSNTPLVRRLLLFGVPLAVAALGLIHPGGVTNPGHEGDTIYHELRDQADLFIAVHLVQLVVFSLLGLTVWFLLRDVRGTAAAVSRVALLVFVVVYTAFDSVQGIAVGVLVQKGQGLPEAEQGGAISLIEAYQDSLITGYLNILGGVGSIAWIVALVAAAVALRKAGAGTLAVACVTLAGVVFGIGHPAPFGPIGMVFLLIAAWRLEAARRVDAGGLDSDEQITSRVAAGG